MASYSNHRRVIIQFFLCLAISSSVFAGNERKDSIYYSNRIEALQNSMQYEKIIQLIDSAQLTEPRFFLSKTNAQKSLGYISEVRNTMNKAVNLFPDNLAMLSSFAETAQEIGDNALALTYLDKATKINPLITLMAKKAAITYSEQNYARSLATTDTILKNSSVASVIRLKSRNLAALKRIPEAVSVLENQYMLHPEDYSTMQQLANLYLAIDSIQKMVNLTGDYVKKDSSDTKMLNLYAKASYLNNDFVTSVKVYKKIENMGVKFDYDQNFFAALANYKVDREFPYTAYDYLVKADSLSDGKFYAVKYYLGQMAEKTGQFKDAFTYYKQAFEIIKPDTVQLIQVTNNLGQAAMKCNDVRSAIKYYEQVLTYDDKNEFAILSMALAYDYLKEVSKASYFYKKLLEIAPDVINNPFSNKAAERLKLLNKGNKNK